MNSDLPGPNLGRFSIKVINLENDKSKRDLILQQLEVLNLTKFVQVVNAVNGELLSNKYLSDIRLQQKQLNSLKFNRTMSSGEIGCFLSHMSIFKSMEIGDICLVLEDDVILSPKLVDMIGLIDKLPSDWDIVLLGNFIRGQAVSLSVWGRAKISNFTLGKPIELSYGSHGYLICYKGARKFLQNTKFPNAPIDHYINNPKFLNVYALKDPIIHQSGELKHYSVLEYKRNLLKLNLAENSRLEKFKNYLKGTWLNLPIRFLLMALRWIAVFRIVRYY